MELASAKIVPIGQFSTMEDRQISEAVKIDDSARTLCYKTTIIPSFRAYARCYAFSRRTGAESTSDEAPSAVVPVFKINPTPIKLNLRDLLNGTKTLLP